MTLPREEVCKGLVSELEDFERLVRTLSPSELSTQSRCDGWAVADVIAHVAGTMTDVVEGRIEGQGTDEVTERQVVERRGRSVDELATELHQAAEIAKAMLATFDDERWTAPMHAGFDFSLGVGVEALWYDAYVHGDDVRSAIGQPSERGDGLRASVSHVADLLRMKGWGPATLELDGLDPVRVGDGSGQTITGDALAFVLAATGRLDPTSLGLDPSVNVYG